MIGQYNSLMTHFLNLHKRKRNINGDFKIIKTFSNLKGFVEYNNFLYSNDKNEKIEATAIVYLMGDAQIDINHEYWVIDQLAPQVRNSLEVLKISPIDNPINGFTDHYEIICR